MSREEKSKRHSFDQAAAFDSNHLWHPYSAMKAAAPPYPVASASGVHLHLADGRKLIDGMSSWWAAIHGYNHPVLNEALRRQLDDMAHVMFGGLTHQPAVDLGQRLMDVLPSGLDRIFFCDSGSVAVEVAIKMASQYWFAQNRAERHRIIAVRYGYHGDTFGAMSVSDPDNGMHWMFSHLLPKQIFARAPECINLNVAAGSGAMGGAATGGVAMSGGMAGGVAAGRGAVGGDAAGGVAAGRGAAGGEAVGSDAASSEAADGSAATSDDVAGIDAAVADMADKLHRHSDEVAAVIVEPVVQGAGGMRIYHPEYLKRLRMLCDQFGVLLIFDEIATGFGRTGRMFAAEHAAVKPDIICIGKALSGGYLSLAAAVATPAVASQLDEGQPGVFMHGPTYMANPSACAVACASLDLLAEGRWQVQVATIEAQLRTELAPCAASRRVRAVRVQGAVGVVEMNEAVDAAALCRQFVGRGVWIRPFGKLIYLMPPYIIQPDELSQLTQAVADVCRA